MNNRFDNISNNVSIIQNISYIDLGHIHFSEITVVIGHSSSMCLTDEIFLQTHVTFCEYLVFLESVTDSPWRGACQCHYGQTVG